MARSVIEKRFNAKIYRTRVTASATLTANKMTVVEFPMVIPSGYTPIIAYDDSYFANITGTLIRIGNTSAAFNYWSTLSDSRTLSAQIIAVPTELLTS